MIGQVGIRVDWTNAPYTYNAYVPEPTTTKTKKPRSTGLTGGCSSRCCAHRRGVGRGKIKPKKNRVNRVSRFFPFIQSHSRLDLYISLESPNAHTYRGLAHGHVAALRHVLLVLLGPQAGRAAGSGLCACVKPSQPVRVVSAAGRAYAIEPSSRRVMVPPPTQPRQHTLLVNAPWFSTGVLEDDDDGAEASGPCDA